MSEQTDAQKRALEQWEKAQKDIPRHDREFNRKHGEKTK